MLADWRLRNRQLAGTGVVGPSKWQLLLLQVPTIDQATGIRSKENEPTETLHRIRSGRVLGWTNPPPFKNSVFFAWNLVTQV